MNSKMCGIPHIDSHGFCKCQVVEIASKYHRASDPGTARTAQPDANGINDQAQSFGMGCKPGHYCQNRGPSALGG